MTVLVCSGGLRRSLAIDAGSMSSLSVQIKYDRSADGAAEDESRPTFEARRMVTFVFAAQS